MAKIDTNGWAADKARRDARIAAGLCPMCGKPKREQDQFDCDACMQACQAGSASEP